MPLFKGGIFIPILKYVPTVPFKCNVLETPTWLSSVQSRGYAARRGTRDKANKKKVKVEVKKIGFIPHNLREKSREKGVVSRRKEDFFYPLAIDDVYVKKFFRWEVHDINDAIECFKETHHPECYNLPASSVGAFIELDMTGVKKTKFVESFTRIAPVSHPFNHGEERSVLAFCKTPELKDLATAAGATLVGDVDALKKIERGEIMLPDFQHIIAHPNILPELVSVRGLLKKKFPSPKNGTLGTNIGEIIQTIKTGIQYTALRDESELDYGSANVIIGTLNMDAEKLRDNLVSVLENIQTVRPQREGLFITRVMLTCQPSPERLKIDLEPLIGVQNVEVDSDSDDEEVSRARTA